MLTCHCLANIDYILNDFSTFCGTESEILQLWKETFWFYLLESLDGVN